MRQVRRARIWFQIDLEQTVLTLDTLRERVVRALNYLSEQNVLELQVSGVRMRYRRLKPAADPQQQAVELHQRILKREAADLERLQLVLDLANHDHCQTATLAQYFGDNLEQACGHCSYCLNGDDAHAIRGKLPAQRPGSIIDEALWAQAVALKQELEQAQKYTLSEPLTLTRFLCGITSPQLSRAQLSSHVLFGAFAQVPFQIVLIRASQEE